MTLILDYSLARPDPAAIKAAGYSGVMRYLAPDNPLTHAKLLLAPEKDALLAAGLTIGLVWEWTANRASQGFAAGSADCLEAETQAKALGYPTNLPIFYAVDFSALLPDVLPYFQGISKVATRPVGVYGDLIITEGILNAGAASVSWQCCAWSGLAVSPRASLYQRLQATVSKPISGADESVLLHPFPMWGSVAQPVVVHPPVIASPLPPVFTKPPVAPPPVLKVGSTGANVRALQMGLNAVFPAYSHLVADGVFGPATDYVVKQFQAREGLPADGIVGPNTRAKLASVSIRV